MARKPSFRSTPFGGTWRDLAEAVVISLLALAVVQVLAVLYKLTVGASWLAAPVPRWQVLAGIAVGLAIALTGAIWTHRTFGGHQVLLVLSDFERHTYFSELARQVVVGLEKMQPDPIDTVLKVPDEGYDQVRQHQFLAAAVRRKASFRGAILVPIDGSQEDLRNFIDHFDQPVVFLDTPPWAGERYPEHSCFVGIDGRDGGRLAAESMVHELDKAFGEAVRRQGEGLRLLVVGGGFHAEREEGFVERLQAPGSGLLPGAQVPCCDNHGGFRRSQGREVVEPLLRSAGERGLPYHGVFCTGDEMALGVLDAVALTGRRGVAERWVLIGYDGIPEATRIIRSGETAFKNTVVQDPKQLAKEALRCLQQLEQGRLQEPVVRLPARLLLSLPPAAHAEPNRLVAAR